MVRLKYGTSTLLSNNMIVEAEKSLSEWMAAQKAMQVGVGTWLEGHLPALLRGSRCTHAHCTTHLCSAVCGSSAH